MDLLTTSNLVVRLGPRRKASENTFDFPGTSTVPRRSTTSAIARPPRHALGCFIILRILLFSAGLELSIQDLVAQTETPPATTPNTDNRTTQDEAANTGAPALTPQQVFERTRVPIRDDSRQFQVYVKNARQLRTEDVVLQQRDFSCGAAALATILNKYWGENVSETALLVGIARTLSPEELEDRINNGLSLTDLKRLLERFGYQAVLGRLTIDKLRDSKIPLLVGITVNDFDHFVVIRGADDDYVYIADPAVGKMRVPIADFEKQWQKNTVLVVIRPNTKPPTNSVLTVTEEEKRLSDINNQFLRNTITGRAFR